MLKICPEDFLRRLDSGYKKIWSDQTRIGEDKVRVGSWSRRGISPGIFRKWVTRE